MNGSQRTVLVVALGLVLHQVERFVLVSASDGGWFGYAPNTSMTFSAVGGVSPVGQLLLRCGLVACWSATSWWLLRTRRDPTDRHRTDASRA